MIQKNLRSQSDANLQQNYSTSTQFLEKKYGFRKENCTLLPKASIFIH
jgi:hypothetical protein